MNLRENIDQQLGLEITHKEKNTQISTYICVMSKLIRIYLTHNKTILNRIENSLYYSKLSMVLIHFDILSENNFMRYRT